MGGRSLPETTAYSDAGRNWNHQRAVDFPNWVDALNIREPDGKVKCDAGVDTEANHCEIEPSPEATHKSKSAPTDTTATQEGYAP